MRLRDSIALVTGANRGLGREVARQLLERGASKVYATARNPERVELPGVETFALDVTDPAAVAAAAAAASDVTVLVNNAGVCAYQPLVTGDLDHIRLEIETNFFGTLHMIRAFAPVLDANGGGAILNLLSRVSWLPFPAASSYAASKAATWSLTNGVRLEIAAQGTLVTGFVLGVTDTDMTAAWDVPKNDPADVVRLALDGIEAGRLEVIGDQDSADAKAALSADPAETYPELAAASAAPTLER